MAVEAQRLISISLGKIAYSRSQRGGTSLHKSLMVATVLQKARHIFMEETFHLMHSYRNQSSYVSEYNQDCGDTSISDEQADDSSVECSYSEYECSDDKENQGASEQPTYLDLDTCQRAPTGVLCDSGHRINSQNPKCGGKRKRVVTEAETEEAISSILPKKLRTEVYETDCDSDSSSDEYDSCSEEYETADEDNSMEIEQITSLVSIFSFGGFSRDCGKLTRSMSTPDLCSTQANDMKSMQPRAAVALAV